MYWREWDDFGIQQSVRVTYQKKIVTYAEIKVGLNLWIFFDDLRLVPGGAKHVRHHGQDSVDSTFFMKTMVNSVHIWSVDLVHVEDDVQGSSLFKSQCKRIHVVFG